MMAKRIGTVADVAAGRVQVGYTTFHALLRSDLIYDKDDVVEHPTDAYQIKVQPSGDGKVQVTVVDLAVGIVQTRRMFESVCNPVVGEREANERVADEVIQLARELKPNTVLRVT